MCEGRCQNRAWPACKGADGIGSAPSWISILSLPHTERKSLFSMGRKAKKSSFCLLGGPQHFEKGAASISGADWTRPLYPTHLYFLARSHLRVTTEMLKCFRGKRQATRTPQPVWSGSLTLAPPHFQNTKSLVRILAAALAWGTLPRRPGPGLSLSSSFEE